MCINKIIWGSVINQSQEHLSSLITHTAWGKSSVPTTHWTQRLNQCAGKWAVHTHTHTHISIKKKQTFPGKHQNLELITVARWHVVDRTLLMHVNTVVCSWLCCMTHVTCKCVKLEIKKCWVVLTQLWVNYGQTQPLGYIFELHF